MTQPPQKRQNPIVPLLQRQNHAISEALRGSPVTVEAFATALRASVAGNRDLAECVQANPESVMICIMQAAQLGLRPGPVYKHFALIPRNMGKLGWVCKGQIEYRGLLDLALRSKQYDAIDARCVYRGEKFDYDPVMGTVNHPYDLEDSVDRSDENLVAVYAWAVVKDRDRPVVRVLRRHEVEKRRESSDAWKAFKAGKIKSTPWVEQAPAMWRKTAIRSLFESGLVPLGDDFMKRIAEVEDSDEEEVFVDANVGPDLAALEAEAKEMMPDGLTREEIEEEIAKLEDGVGLSPDQTSSYAVETYGSDPNELSLPLLWRLAQDVSQGLVQEWAGVRDDYDGPFPRTAGNVAEGLA